MTTPTRESLGDAPKTPDTPAEMARFKKRLMGITSAVVVVACGVYIWWGLRAPPPVEAELPKATPAIASIMERLGGKVLQMPLVSISPSEDGSSVVVSGSVSSEALLRDLKAAVDGAEPKIPVTFSVQIAR
jgi:hypothetical protein